MVNIIYGNTGAILRVLFGCVISGGLIYLIIRSVNWDAVLSSLVLADMRWIAAAVIVQFTAYFIRAPRWKILQFPERNVNYYPLFLILSISYMFNSLLPFRLGEIARVLLCSQRMHVSKVQSAAFLVLEKAFDAIVIFLLMTAMLFTAQMPAAIAGLVKILGLVVALGAGVATGMILFQRKILAMISYFPSNRLSSRLISIWNEVFSLGLKLRNLMFVLIITVFVWLTEALGYYCIGLALGLLWQYPAAILLMAGVKYATMIPSAPGYIGTFQYAAIFVLGLLGIPFDQAVAYGIASHVTVYLPITLVGLVHCLASGLTLSRLQNEKRKPGRLI